MLVYVLVEFRFVKGEASMVKYVKILFGTLKLFFYVDASKLKQSRMRNFSTCMNELRFEALHLLLGQTISTGKVLLNCGRNLTLLGFHKGVPMADITATDNCVVLCLNLRM